MLITDALLGEHAVFYAQFDDMEQMTGTRQVEEVKTSAALLVAGLASHAALEDELLFCALEPAMGTGMGPIAVMRSEHEEIEGNLYRLAGVNSAAAARELLLATIDVARQHFSKEERVIFPMARQALGSDDLEELAHEWANRRMVFVG
jgi:iron-sulfur cluster repair protein YtfE (RIC family)